MPCFHPKQVYFAKLPNANGKYSIVFDKDKALAGGLNPFKIPCRKCTGCRLDKSNEWAFRIVCETKTKQSSCFVTLTLNPDELDSRPNPYTLVKADIQNFIKRLRYHLSELDNGIKISYFAAGEYGTEGDRPHYHVIIFGYDFPDKVFLKNSPSGHPMYTSDFLSKSWDLGYHSIASVDLDSARYVAKYTQKKVTGDPAFDHYLAAIDPLTGEAFVRLPEFALMSKSPAIGFDWYNLYHQDLFIDDCGYLDGIRFQTPEFFDKLSERLYPDRFKLIKSQRKLKAAQFNIDNSPSRLIVREYILSRKLTKFPRGTLMEF